MKRNYIGTLLRTLKIRHRSTGKKGRKMGTENRERMFFAFTNEKTNLELSPKANNNNVN